MGIIVSICELALETRCRNQIKNELNRKNVIYGEQLQANSYRAQYPNAQHRPTRACITYNCHGLTFASRRTWISETSAIEMILKDDEYRPVDSRDVMVGDVAVSMGQDGDAEHSGWVVSVEQPFPFGPSILSKWGKCHEVVHRWNQCPYDTRRVLFFRIES